MPRQRVTQNGPLELIVAALLRKRRYELKMPQNVLTERLKTNRRTVGELEKGEIHLNITHLAMMCEILGTEPWIVLKEAQEILEKGEKVPKFNGPLQKLQDEAKSAPVVGWYQTTVPEHLRREHAASANKLRRENQERDLEDSAELCEADES